VTTVLVLDPIDGDALAALGQEYHVVVAHRPAQAELLGLVADADAIVVRSGVRLDATVIAAASKLRVIARAGSGVDNIDLDAARSAGAVVFNVPGLSARAVAEHALGLMLAVRRHIATADRQVRAGVWNKAALTGDELGGQTLGLVGLGTVGTSVARLARAFDMRVLASVARPSAHRRRLLGVDEVVLSPLDDLLTAADIVCLAVPLTMRTRNLIDAAALARMKPTSVLVNVSRGEVVEEAALAEAVEHGTIAGAALDVVRAEGSTLLSRFENVVVTPHLGAMTAQAQARIGRALVPALRAALDGQEVDDRCC
jgi:D-3-phosphoglycerate dehydrogenase